MRILVTGRDGQLGKSIKKIVDSAQQQHEFVFTDRSILNLGNDNDIKKYFDNNKFDTIINCAAYTQVDKAEDDLDLVNQVNHLAVKQLAIIAQKNQTKLIHVSTNFVFDGSGKNPYTEKDSANPVNVYGDSKLAGERAIEEIMPVNAIIIRIGWLYSEYGNNFVDTMLRIGKEKDQVRVISDQIGTPTYATDVAKALLQIILNKKNNANFNSEIYHYSPEGACSWYEFAKSIFEYKKNNCKLIKITERDWSAKAQRPGYSVLSSHKIQKKFGLVMPFWLNSLHTCLDVIKNE